MATPRGWLRVSHILINKVDIDINLANDEGITPLMLALKHGHIDIARHFLLRQDSEINKLNIDYRTALRYTELEWMANLLKSSGATY
jgi:ankyrin repeat protein